MSNKTFKNSFFSVLKTFCTLIFPVITFSYTSRIFLKDGIGRINFARSFISIISMIAMLGIRYYGIRECAKKRDSKKALSKLFSELIVINSISTIIAYIILIFLLMFSEKINSYKIEIELYSITLILAVIGVDWFYAAMEDYKYLAVRSILLQILSLIAVLFFVHNKSDIYVYIIIQIVATCGINIFGLLNVRKYVCFVVPRWNNMLVHIKPILNLFLVTMFIQVFTDMDTVMLGYLSNDIETGLYSSAYKISTIICSMISAGTTVIMPKMAYVLEKGEENEANGLLQKSIQFVLMIGVPLSVGLLIYSRNFIVLLSGSDFIDATVPSMILSMRTLLSPINGMILLHYLIPRNNDKEAIIITAIAAFLNICLNAFLIPYYGSIGASIATVCSEIIELFFIMFFLKKYINYKYIFSHSYQYFVGGIPVFIIAFMTTFLIQNIVLSVIIGVLVSAPIYYLVLRLMKNQYIYLIEEFTINTLRRVSA